ncbi:DivIVA domain-containing protein [Nocardioides sp.]|uniref:DivIVA domain-containing protein n=1 Tax=Nocardioides sp. TaxID=35761 RepID=UPI002727843D|nr:DivIVA domain-containing protein [Nocardioides sp.]MDO9455674.1 DivIVA domain-containing protein [Nocardioides sp.]
MTWFFAVVVVLAMGGIALVASGRGAPMVDEYDDRPDALVPADGDLGPHDLRRVRFSITFRGYRMSEVDALLSRLASEMEADQAWQPPVDPAVGPAVGPADEPADGPDPTVTLAKETGSRPDDVPPG